MTRGVRWAAVVASVVILAGCRSVPEPRKEPLVIGELPYECVWSTCSAATLALNRCAPRGTVDALAYQDCMRREGYQPFQCEAGTPDCTPRLDVLH